MIEKKEFEVSLKHKLKNLSKNSPVFFKAFFYFKNNKIVVKPQYSSATYTFDINRSLEPSEIVREIYLTLYDKEYPRLESLDGTVYVINKVNLSHNLILLKKLNDPDCEELYACRLKIPVVVFLRDYCSQELDMTPIDRWNIYVSNISSIYRGENIYGI